MNDKFEISVRLAKALLMKDGVLSIREIRAIPHVRSRAEALAVARRLAKIHSPYFSVEIVDDIISGDLKLRIALDEARISARTGMRTPA